MTLATRAKIEWFKSADLKMWEFKSIYEFAKKEVKQMSMLKNPSKKASDDLEYYRVGKGSTKSPWICGGSIMIYEALVMSGVLIWAIMMVYLGIEKMFKAKFGGMRWKKAK